MTKHITAVLNHFKESALPSTTLSLVCNNEADMSGLIQAIAEYCTKQKIDLSLFACPHGKTPEHALKKDL